MIRALLIGLVLVACAPQRQSDPGRASRRLALVDQGVAALRANELRAAEAAFELAWRVDPDAAALDGLGCVAFLRGQSKLAEEFFLRALNFDSKYAAGYANLALLYEVGGYGDRAIELYQRALALDPENSAARNNFAVALHTGRNEAPEGIRLELEMARVQIYHPVVERNLRYMEARHGETKD